MFCANTTEVHTNIHVAKFFVACRRWAYKKSDLFGYVSGRTKKCAHCQLRLISLQQKCNFNYVSREPIRFSLRKRRQPVTVQNSKPALVRHVTVASVGIKLKTKWGYRHHKRWWERKLCTQRLLKMLELIWNVTCFARRNINVKFNKIIHQLYREVLCGSNTHTFLRRCKNHVARLM